MTYQPFRFLRRLRLWVTYACLLAWIPDAAAAQIDIEIPVLIELRDDDNATGSTGSYDDLDATQLVLSAAKRYETVQESSAIVTVVTRNQIRARGYRTLAELLDTIPGFEGRRPQQNEAGTSLETIARGSVRTVLVLWNGVPLNTPETNGRTLGQDFSLGVVERVEVLAGAGGVLWGANAFLGVVSITTIRPDESEATVDILAGGGPGMQSTGIVSATVARSWWDDRVRMLAHLEYFSSGDATIKQAYNVEFGPFLPPDADAAFALASSTGDTQTSRDLYMPLTLAVDTGPLRIDVLYPIVYRRSEEIGYRGIRTDEFRTVDGEVRRGTSETRRNSVALASATLSGGNRLLQYTTRAYYTAFDDEGRLASSPPGLFTEQTLFTDTVYAGANSLLRDGSYRTGLTIDATLSRGRHRLIAGVDSYFEKTRARERTSSVGYFSGSGSALPEEQVLRMSRVGSRVVAGAFSNHRISLTDRFTIEGGIRGQVSPGAYSALVLGSASVLWNPLRRVYVKFNGAQGFRPPPFRAITINDDVSFAHVQASPDLRPERSIAFEGEVSAIVLRGTRRFRYASVRSGAQFTRLEDLVVEVRGISDNAGQRDIYSAFVAIDLAITGGHRLGASYSFISGRDVRTGPLRHIANHKIHFNTELKLSDNLMLVGRATLMGRSEDLNRLPVSVSDTAFTAPSASIVVDRLPPVGVAHVGLRADGLFDDRFDVGLHVDNVLDSRHAIPDSQFDKRVAPLPLFSPGLGAFVTMTGRWQ